MFATQSGYTPGFNNHDRRGPGGRDDHAFALAAVEAFAVVLGGDAQAGALAGVPYLRSADDAVLAQDVLELMNALHVPEAVLAGVELGARVAARTASLKPSRCVGLVTLNTQPQAGFADVVALMARAGHWRT